MERKDFEAIAVIAKRKAEFYASTRKKLIDSLPESIDKGEVETRLSRAISELDNGLFISDEERVSRTLHPELSIKQLTLKKQEIVDGIVRAMTAG